MIRERVGHSAPGILMLLALIAAVLFAGYAGVTSFVREDVRGGLFWTLTLMVGFVMFLGLFMVNPNEGRVLQLFGDYRGTVKTPGLRWTNPFYSKHHVSLRIHNFESGKLKVNDKLRLVPGHCDPTCNVHDWYVGVRNGKVEQVWPITARGLAY